MTDSQNQHLHLKNRSHYSVDADPMLLNHSPGIQGYVVRK